MPPLTIARVRLGQLDRRHGDALAEGAVREVDLAPRARRWDRCTRPADLVGDVDPGRRAEAELRQVVVQPMLEAVRSSCRA